MRQILYPLVLVITALGVGFGLSYFSLEGGREMSATQFGVWSGWPELGTAQIDPYARAYLTRQGMLPLGKGEGTQFFAHKDRAGEPLWGQCRYVLAGKMPLHALWTLQLRDPSSKRVFGHVHSGTMQYGDSGDIRLAIAPTAQSGNWINTDGLHHFELLLTLYDTTVFSSLGADEIKMPQIDLEAC